MSTKQPVKPRTSILLWVQAIVLILLIVACVNFIPEISTWITNNQEPPPAQDNPVRE